MDEPGDRFDGLRSEAESDLSRVIAEIESLTGFASRWSGEVIVRGLEFGQAGQKHGWCGISIREDVLLVPEYRWTTMIHEGLHSVSAAFGPARLDPTNRRWEEAIVEQAQRLLRTDLLAALHIELDEDVLRARDGSHRYNEHIRALEAQRNAEGDEAREFYMRLLGSPPYDRARMLVAAWRAMASRAEREE